MAKDSSRHDHRHTHYAHQVHEHKHLLPAEDILSRPPRMTKEELKRLMDEGAHPLILDMRDPEDYEESDIQIPGSVRMTPAELHSVIEKLPRDRAIVIY